MKNQYTYISQLLNYSLIISGIIASICYYQIQGLPEEKQISASLSEDPLQTATSRSKFEFKYEGKQYVIEPLYDYSITGLVVTHNNIESIADAYHNKSSVDIKDLCVIWGDNFKQNNHKKLKFWSEPWTCFVQYNDYDVGAKFRGDQLSNNHLLSDQPIIRRKIKQAKVGDQVRFSGMLVSYYQKHFPDMARKSSTIRTDTGNGACEVVFVENFEILKVWQKPWADAYNMAGKFFTVIFVLKIVSFFLFPYLEYRAIPNKFG